MTCDAASLFDGVEQTQMVIDGHEVVVPLRYQSGTAMAGVFAAHSRALLAKVPDPRIRPAILAPGVSPVLVVGLTFATDIGPVNELCVGVPLRRGRAPIPLASFVSDAMRGEYPTWIWHLPVSTAIATVLGREVWGFPKIHADIPITQDERGSHSVRVSELGAPILALYGPPASGTRSMRMRFLNHLWQDGAHLQKADYTFALDRVGVALRPRTGRLDLLSEHPIAQDLRDVLISTRPLAFAYAGGLQALLGAPKELFPSLLDRLRRYINAHEESAAPPGVAPIDRRTAHR
jgi:Acetoacetate decarboxylase (ADC)